jgi:transcriptional regulator GlxA family with amidase domain
MRYRQINGRSVRTTIEAVRLSNAKRLLLETHLSHREIARSCAFSSEGYLEKVFLRRFGQTMGSFRRQGNKDNKV